jgi:SAM-dependent methyltransferase
MTIYTRLREKWVKRLPDTWEKTWWGDPLDVRCHLSWELGKLHGKKVLDVGCCVGVVLSEVPDDNERYGIDNSEDYIRIARRFDGKARFRVADMLNLPFKDNEFDVVILAHMIDTERHKRILTEAGRVLKTGGTLYLTTPNGEHPLYRRNTTMPSCAELEEMLEGFDFRIYGYNPYPLLRRKTVISKIPGVFTIMRFSMGFRKNRSVAFFARAVRV